MLVGFLLLDFSLSFYIFHRHQVCPVDCMDLICSLYHWWKGLGFSSLAILPLGFNGGSVSTSVCELSTGVYSLGCPGGLGLSQGGLGVQVV